MFIPSISNAFSDSAQIIIALGVLVAAFTYYYQKDKDSTDAAIEQVSFYRKEIIRAGRELRDHVRKSLNDDKYNFTRIENIPDFSMEWLRMYKRPDSDKQLEPFETKPILQREAEDYINLLEDLSTQILHTKTIDHPAIFTIRPGFVGEVESLASIIATYRFHSDDIYNGIIEVYEIWKDKIDRDDLQEKLRKTKESLEARKKRGEKPTFI